MKIYPNKLLVVALFLGWLFDFLFWEHSIGVNFAIFATVCMLFGIGILVSSGFRPAKKTLWLLIPFLFFSVVTFLRQEPLTIFLAYTFTTITLILLVNSYLDGQWIQYGLSDYLVKSIGLMASMVRRPFPFLVFNPQVDTENSKNEEIKNKLPIGGIIRGLLIALPIVIFFTSMLASADLVFDQKLADFLDKFETEDIAEYIERMIYILLCAYILVGIFLHAAFASDNTKALAEKKKMKQFLGFTEASIVLGSVSLLFLIFVIIQFQYFFGGQENIGVEGYSYSQYARRGFNELINVAFFSLLMIIGLGKLTHRESETQKRIYSGLSIFLVLLVMVILVSAYQRINLGIDWHGYSRLRLYPRIFLIWVGILFITIVTLESFRLEKYFTFAFLMASFGFGVSLTLANVDNAIVKYNIERVVNGKNLNTIHLSSLSTDAISVLVDEFKSPNIPDPIREGIGAILVCYIHSYPMNDESLDENFQSFNYSRWSAHKALDSVMTDLSEYKILEKRYPMLVRTPLNLQYECSK